MTAVQQLTFNCLNMALCSHGTQGSLWDLRSGNPHQMQSQTLMATFPVFWDRHASRVNDKEPALTGVRSPL